MEYQDDNSAQRAHTKRPHQVPVGFVPEQERNFDAGHTPSPTPMRFIREEMIDGKLYKVWQQ